MIWQDEVLTLFCGFTCNLGRLQDFVRTDIYYGNILEKITMIFFHQPINGLKYPNNNNSIIIKLLNFTKIFIFLEYIN